MVPKAMGSDASKWREFRRDVEEWVNAVRPGMRIVLRAIAASPEGTRFDASFLENLRPRLELLASRSACAIVDVKTSRLSRRYARRKCAASLFMQDQVSVLARPIKKSAIVLCFQKVKVLRWYPCPPVNFYPRVPTV